MTYGKLRGGDVLIAVNNKIFLWIINRGWTRLNKIYLNKIKIVLDWVYIPPDATIDLYSNHGEVLEPIFFPFLDHHFLITGVFNLNSFDWTIVRKNIISLLVCYLIVMSVSKIWNNLHCIQNHLDHTQDYLFLSSDAELIFIVHSSESLTQIIDYEHPLLELYTQLTDFFRNSNKFSLAFNF